jgi:hypothetical protein
VAEPNHQKLSRKDFEDYEFVVAELAKMAQMNFAQIKEHHSLHPEDSLHTLKHPKDKHLMLFTREGAKRLWQVARRGLKSLGPESTKYELKTVVDAIEKLFLARLVDDPSSINDEQAHELFRQALADVSKDFVSSTHHVPCSLAAHRSPAEFRIGPVDFQLSEAFWKKNGQSIIESLKRELQHDTIKQFFTQQWWVASVEVEPCDPIVAERRATEAVQSSLDLFKLFVGSSRAARVGHAYVAGLPRHFSRLYSDSEGFHVTQSWSSGNAIVKDDWLTDVANFLPWVFGAETISNRLRTWGRLPDPEQRFLDALAWHSEGISESNLAARILKFWTAIERTVSLKIRDRVSARAAILSDEVTNFPEQFEKCQRLYSLRSEIIHGTYNGDEGKLASSSHETEKVSQAVITSYAYIAGQFKAANRLSRAIIETEFKRLDGIALRIQTAKRN